MTATTGPRWAVSYRSALDRSTPPATLTIEADTITSALKLAQMKIAEMDGAWKITSIRGEDDDPLPPAREATAACLAA